MRLLSIAILGAVMTIAGCGVDSDGARLERQAVVIGIDGADWRIIDELAAEGEMPNLTRLRQRGVSGRIETLTDLALSPVIWTSVATGKSADKHGIAWFLIDQPDGTRAPVRSDNRTAKAIWNILGESGHRPVVVGWWATYPAEPVGAGKIVSDGLGYHGFGATARDGDDHDKTYPPSLYETVRARVPDEQEISAEFAGRFIHIDPDDYREAMFDPSRSTAIDPGNPIHLFQQYALTAQGYTAIAEELLVDEYDLFMLYYEQVDSLSHLFMKYAPPSLEWVDRTDQERYRDVVRQWYRYQDELLGRILRRVDLDRTAVFVLSDHGFKSGERRIKSERTVDIRRAHLDHETHGIFLAAGPSIRRGAEIGGASVLDITPTLLHYLGLSVGHDMDGKVLEQIFEPDFREEHPVRYIETYEPEVPPETERRSVQAAEYVDAQLEERLIALGYLDEADVGATSTASASAGSSPELHNNLGRALLGRGKLEEAQQEFEKALALDPRSADALLNLGTIRRLQGRIAEAEHLAKRALRLDPDSIRALSELAEIRRDQDDLQESIRLYREALSLDDSRPSLYVGLGDCQQRAGLLEQAESSFRDALALDPDSFEAHYNLGVTFMARGRMDEAVAIFEKALDLHPDHPQSGHALNNLGNIHLDRGDVDRAMEMFRDAAEVSPGRLEPPFNLGSLYFARGQMDLATEWLERAAAVAPDHEVVNLRLGSVYLETGRAEEARRSFLLVRRLYPMNWHARLGLAQVYARSSEPDKARQFLAEALDLGARDARERAEANPLLAPLIAP